MPRKLLIFGWLFLFITLSCTSGGAEQQDSAPVAASIYGEGSISSELPEFATSFSSDGKTIYFNRASADRSSLQILTSTLTNGQWSEPIALPFSDGKYFDVDPFVSSDGERLYFSSNRPVEGDSTKDFDTWYVERVDNGWSEPVNAGAPLNGPDSEVFVSLTNEQTIYFSISTNGVRRIYRSEQTANGYTPPSQIDVSVADSIGMGNPLIDPDERYLLFTSRQLDGYGAADIFIVDHLGDGRFDNARNAGPAVNSAYSDFAPGFGADGETLYFTSERPGIVGPLEEGRPPGDLYEISLEALPLN